MRRVAAAVPTNARWRAPRSLLSATYSRRLRRGGRRRACRALTSTSTDTTAIRGLVRRKHDGRDAARARPRRGRRRGGRRGRARRVRSAEAQITPAVSARADARRRACGCSSTRSTRDSFLRIARGTPADAARRRAADPEDARACDARRATIDEETPSLFQAMKPRARVRIWPSRWRRSSPARSISTPNCSRAIGTP